MKNLMPEVLKLIGLSVDEEFKIAGLRGLYKCNKDGLIMCKMPCQDWEYVRDVYLNHLFSGVFHIEKLPFKPKVGRLYYAVESEGFYARTWGNDMSDFIIYFKLGNCFRTKEEAESNADRIRKEIMG